MTTSPASQTLSVRGILFSSPYSRGFAKTLVVAIVGSMACGFSGLGAKLQPLLLDTAFSSLLLMLFGAYMIVDMIRGSWLAGKNGEMLGEQWASIWTPITVVLTAGVLLPIHDGVSTLSLALLDASYFGEQLASWFS